MLEGLRVVELGSGRAAGYAGKLFADLGATVVRVAVTPDADLPEGLRAYLHDATRGIALDVETPAGIAACNRLIDHADILIHGGIDVVSAAAVLAPDRLTRTRPNLVVASITPFGWNSALRNAPADDLTLQALGGICNGIGLPDRPPLKLPGDQSAFQAGLCAAIGALGQWFAGRGSFVDVSAADIWAGIYSGVEVANAHFGRARKPRAGHRVSRVPYPRTIYPCRDGYFAVQCAVTDQWLAFLRMTGREDLAAHPLFVNRLKANDEHGNEADALFEPWFRARSKEEILELCLRHRIPAAPVYGFADVVGHEQLDGRAYFDSANVGDDAPNTAVRMPTMPFPVETRKSGGPRGLGIDGLDTILRALGDHEPGAAPASSVATPLAGVRVIDFGWVWAGAVPGHILADLGAEVIKVESMTRIDYMRQGRPIKGKEKDPEQNPMFHNVNRGKLSFRVNMTSPQGAELLKQLVRGADVVIENFAPGVMDRFGLGWTTLSAQRSDLIMCSMSAVGAQGPLRDIRTYATMIAGLSGLDALVRYPGGRVLGSQSSYADPNASLHAAFAILAALYQRRRGGVGRHIDLSQWEAAVNVMAEQLIDWQVSGRDSHCMDSGAAPYGNYPTAGDDRWIALAVATDAQWLALAQALGAPAWMAEARFATVTGRRTNRLALDQQLSLQTRSCDGQDLANRLLAAGVAAAPVLPVGELARHPQFVGRALFPLIHHPVLGYVPVYGLPWQLDGKPCEVTRRAPLMGEHNDYVLKELLKLDEAAIDALALAGALD